MKKINYFSMLALLFVSSFFAACSKDEDAKPADLRTQVEGTYNYRLKYYDMSSGSPEYLGSEEDEIGTLIAKKNTKDDMIDFMEGGELAFQGSKLAQANNGVAFDIPSQTMKDDDTTYTIVGYNGNEIGSTKYHGAYYTADKKVSIYFTLEGYDLLMAFEGTKQ